MAGHRDQVGVLEADALIGCFGERGERARGVALRDALKGRRAEEPAVIRARLRTGVEQAAGARQPSRALRPLIGVGEIPEGEPVRAAARAQRVALFEERAVGARPRPDARLISSRQGRRGGEPLEVLGFERAPGISLREPFVRLDPRLAVERRSALCQRGGALHSPIIPHSRGGRVPQSICFRKLISLRSAS